MLPTLTSKYMDPRAHHLLPCHCSVRNWSHQSTWATFTPPWQKLIPCSAANRGDHSKVQFEFIILKCAMVQLSLEYNTNSCNAGYHTLLATLSDTPIFLFPHCSSTLLAFSSPLTHWFKSHSHFATYSFFSIVSSSLTSSLLLPFPLIWVSPKMS